MWFNPGDLLKNEPDHTATSATLRLLPQEEQKILDWLASIGETDPGIIEDTLNRCRADSEVLEYFLKRANNEAINPITVTPVTPEKTKAEAENSNVIVTCFTCRHFQSFNQHGRGAGSCAVHAASGGLCHWHDAKHPCRKYEVRP